jgi:hypothetical protein
MDGTWRVNDEMGLEMKKWSEKLLARGNEGTISKPHQTEPEISLTSEARSYRISDNC